MKDYKLFVIGCATLAAVKKNLNVVCITSEGEKETMISALNANNTDS